MAKCTKKCCDCKNVIGSGEFSQCRAPQDIDKAKMEALRRVGIENPSNRYRIDFASIHRSAGWLWTRVDNQCGKEGRWFVPKKEA
jgi:hypothetical protein